MEVWTCGTFAEPKSLSPFGFIIKEADTYLPTGLWRRSVCETTIVLIFGVFSNHRSPKRCRQTNNRGTTLTNAAAFRNATIRSAASRMSKLTATRRFFYLFSTTLTFRPCCHGNPRLLPSVWRYISSFRCRLRCLLSPVLRYPVPRLR
jgi:hypothetical protein